MALLGSALGGYLLDAHGRHSLLLIGLVTTILALTVVRRMVPRRLEVSAESRSQESQRLNGSANGAFWVLLTVLLLGTALRSLTHNSLNTYFPKLQEDAGMTPATYGLVLSCFWIATALGGVVGAYVADHMGLQRILVGSILLSSAALLAFVKAEGLPSYIFFVLAGLLMGPSHILFMVAGQRRFVQRMAMVSGIFLGFTFASGSGGAWLLGLLADRVGLSKVIGTLPWILLGAAACALIGVPRSAAQFVPEEEDSVTA